MGADSTDLNNTNLDNNQLLHSLADTLDLINKEIADTTKERTLEDYPKILNIVSQTKEVFKELKEIELYDDINLVNELQSNVEALILDIEAKITNGVFDGQDGEDGIDGYTPVKGVDYFDGQDGVDGKDGLDGQAGTTDYNHLLNKPQSMMNPWLRRQINMGQLIDIDLFALMGNGIYVFSNSNDVYPQHIHFGMFYVDLGASPYVVRLDSFDASAYVIGSSDSDISTSIDNKVTVCFTSSKKLRVINRSSAGMDLTIAKVA